MTDEEIKNMVDTAVEEATKALAAKNKQLLGEVRDAKSAKTTAELSAEEAKDEAARKAGDIEALEARLTAKHTAALKAVEEARDNALKEVKSLKIDTVISKSLIDNNVSTHMIAPLEAMFRAGATLDEDGKATYEGKELGGFLTGYFATDAGKHFVSAPSNSGGGATGNASTKSGLWTKKPETAQELSEFSKLAITDPGEYNALCDQHGLGSMKTV
jgi:hypothetical protein